MANAGTIPATIIAYHLVDRSAPIIRRAIATQKRRKGAKLRAFTGRLSPTK